MLPDEQCKLLNLRGEVVLVGNLLQIRNLGSARDGKRLTEEDGPTFSYLLDRVGI